SAIADLPRAAMGMFLSGWPQFVPSNRVPRKRSSGPQKRRSLKLNRGVTISQSLRERDMESRRPAIIDLNAEAAKLTMFRGRTPRSTIAERKGSTARLASYRDGPLVLGKFAGTGHWERHLAGDELIHILDGTATLEMLGEDGAQSFALRAGMIAVNPRGAWHRFSSADGVTLLAVTPSPSEVIDFDVDDPRQIERK